MSRFETLATEDKLEALKYSREHNGQFFEASVPVPGKKPKTVYVVAVSKHRAQLKLVEYLMDVSQWNRRLQDTEYLTELEAVAAKAAEKEAAGDDEPNSLESES